jgi:hypothetical protein
MPWLPPQLYAASLRLVVPLGATLLGRWPKTTTREPGDLPPRTVTRERVGRGVLTNSVRLLCSPHEGEGGPQSAKIAVTDLSRLWGVTWSLSAFAAAAAAAIFWSLPSQLCLQHSPL